MAVRGRRTNNKGRTLIQNNLVFNNGGGGVQMWGSHRLDVINNTLYFNGATTAAQVGPVTWIFVRTSALSVTLSSPAGRTLENQWMASHH